MEATNSLTKASQRTKKNMNAWKRLLEFDVGNKVLLKLTPQISKKSSSKIVHWGLVLKYNGFFKVMKRVGRVAYRLKQPEQLSITSWKYKDIICIKDMSKRDASYLELK